MLGNLGDTHDPGRAGGRRVRIVVTTRAIETTSSSITTSTKCLALAFVITWTLHRAYAFVRVLSFGGLSHEDNRAALLKANFIHHALHQVDSTTTARLEIFRGSRIRNLTNVESVSFIPDDEGNLTSPT